MGVDVEDKKCARKQQRGAGGTGAAGKRDTHNSVTPTSKPSSGGSVPERFALLLRLLKNAGNEISMTYAVGC
jgi:hypothetical protein